jgi:hypothetical protein
MFWSGSSESYVDLNPSGCESSVALGTNGTQQVGEGYGSGTGYRYHAMLWSGSADSFVDLHQFLPTWFLSSEAWSIDGYGNIVGYARDSSDNRHAILWQPCLYNLAGDLNDDCKVDFLDFAIMANNWLIDCMEEPDNPACVHK